MKTHFFLSASLALLLSSSARAQTTPDQHRIVPGERIGRVFLGDSQAVVRRRLGPSFKKFVLGSGLTSEVWRGARRPDNGGFYTLEVVYRRGVVRQIETTNPLFKTSSGLDINDSLASWKARLGKPVVRYFAFPKPGKKPDIDDITKMYQSWKSSGIAMELVQPGVEVFDENNIPPFVRETIIVHPRGASVIPDRGAESSD